MIEAIAVIRHGMALKSFPCELYSLSILNGLVTILHKQTRKVAFVISPEFYDYIEVLEYEDEQDH